jgi:hypothetical protein
MKKRLAAALVLALLAVAAARIPRNDKERQQDEERLRRQQESGIHTYYLLIKAPEGAKNDKARSEALAADFHKRLGGDRHIHIVAASKVRAPATARAAAPACCAGLHYAAARCCAKGLWPLKQTTRMRRCQDKLVMKITGDESLANEMVTAARSFPETAMVEKKPLYRTLDQRRSSRRQGMYRGSEKPEEATM